MENNARRANLGAVVAVRGSVVDIHFDDQLPPIHALLHAQEGEIAIEILAQLDTHRVRGIALTPTQGLARGMADDLRLCALMPYYFTAMVVRLALAEAITIESTPRPLCSNFGGILIPSRRLSGPTSWPHPAGSSCPLARSMPMMGCCNGLQMKLRCSR